MDFEPRYDLTDEEQAKVRELSDLVENDVRTDFIDCEKEFADLIMVGLIQSDYIPTLFDLAVVMRMSKLYDEFDGNIDTALEAYKSR
jgi:hypothetical protein